MITVAAPRLRRAVCDESVSRDGGGDCVDAFCASVSDLCGLVGSTVRLNGHTIIFCLLTACVTPAVQQPFKYPSTCHLVEESSAYFVMAIEHMAESYDAEYDDMVDALVAAGALVIDQDGMLQLGPKLIENDLCRMEHR